MITFILLYWSNFILIFALHQPELQTAQLDDVPRLDFVSLLGPRGVLEASYNEIIVFLILVFNIDGVIITG